MKEDVLKPQRWERPGVRSLLLTILGEFVFPRAAPVWTRTFVSALEVLGFGESGTRQALRRSAAAGWLRPLRRGRETRWELTSSMEAVLRAGSERIYGFGRARRSTRDGWLLLYVAPPASRRRRRQLSERLAWAGFGSLATGVWICPDRSREAEAEAVLDQLDLRETASVSGHAGGIGDVETLVARAWSLDTVAERHRRFLEQVSGLRPRGARARFVALTRMVHLWRTIPYIDPDLPEDLLPRPWIGHRAARGFRELRERWSPDAQRWWEEQR